MNSRDWMLIMTLFKLFLMPLIRLHRRRRRGARATHSEIFLC